MASKVKPIPEGYHSVTPYLTVRGGTQALEFYQQAFGATTLYTMPGPDGRLMHAEMRLGDSIVMLGDEFPEMGGKAPPSLGGVAGGLMLYVEDVDALVERAVKAGAVVVMPVANQFWGDRYGKLRDPFGQEWSVATHIEDVPPDQMAERMKAAMAQQGG
jgi:PhnB protein